MRIPARLNISMFRTVISYLSKHTYTAKVIPILNHLISLVYFEGRH